MERTNEKERHINRERKRAKQTRKWEIQHHANLKPVIRPTSQLEDARLHVVGKKFDVDRARGFINGWGLPEHQARVEDGRLGHQSDLIVAIGAGRKHIDSVRLNQHFALIPWKNIENSVRIL